MDESLAAWLQLRENADRAARSAAVLDAVAARLPAAGPVRVLDLATGTGSNVRYLVERLPGPQHWLAVDRSATLLARLLARTADWAEARGLDVRVTESGCTLVGGSTECHIQIQQRDLASLNDSGLFEGRHLVTASALLDLVSESWLAALASHCRHAGASALFTITYDGRSACEPVEPDDEMVRALFNQHQTRDKGLGGNAAGPAAARVAAQAFANADFEVCTDASDWVLATQARALQRELVEGWAEASTAVAPDRAATIGDWRRRRLAHIDAGRSRTVVGHRDLAAWPRF